MTPVSPRLTSSVWHSAEEGSSTSSDLSADQNGRQQSRPIAESHPKNLLVYTAGPALLSGATQAILFNPIDRALYVRVKFRRRRFLDKRNFERPFQGFMNAAVYRTLVGASYMFWQDTVRIAIERYAPATFQAHTAPQLHSLTIGLAAGSVNGLALNTLQAVKFRMWSTDDRGITFWRTARLMYNEGGLPIFFRGCVTTMVRDSVFGVVYETSRRDTAWKRFFYDRVNVAYAMLNSRTTAAVPGDSAGTCAIRLADPTAVQAGMEISSTTLELSASRRAAAAGPGNASPVVLMDPTQKCGVCAFISNLVAAVLASILSSPFNYVRSVVYGTPPGAIPLGYVPLLKSFCTQMAYIYRHGRSYTDRHGVPELSETEHRSYASSPPTPSGSSSSTELRWRRGNISSGVAATASTATGENASGRLLLWTTRLASALLSSNWASRHHPVAMCRWANSRLNIGWGSLRVGVGMAIGQSLFYLAQDLVSAR